MITRRKVPDGGWGWVIVVGSFAEHTFVDGIIYTAAIFYKPWIDYYKSSVFLTTMAISLMAGASLFVGPIAAAFIAVYGCRKVAVFGSAISTVGLLLTAFAPSIYFLLVSFGLMTGCGFGFVFISSMVVITEYFEKRLAFAVGLASCGSSIGIILFAALIEYLNAHFELQTIIVILSVISLLNFASSLTFVPIDTSVKSVEELSAGLAKLGSPEKNEEIDNEAETSNTDKSPGTSSKEIEQSKVSLFIDSLKTMFGTKLFLNPRFIIYALSSFLVCLGFLAPQIFIKVRAMNLKGVTSEKDTNGLFTVLGVGSTIGRVFFGYIADYKWCHRFVVLIVTTVICGIATIISIYCQIYISLAVYCFVFGLTSGAFISISPVVVSDLFRTEMVANAFGLLTLFEGLAFFIGPPFIGLFESKTYEREFIIAGSLMITGGLANTLIPIYDAFHGQCSQVSSSKPTDNQNPAHK